MLRLRPTVISLTPTDVTEVVHRRRLRKFLECDDDDQCLAFTPAGTEALCNTVPPKPSSSRSVNRKAIPSKLSSSLSSYNRVRPLVVDLPLMLRSEKRVDDDTPRASEAVERQASRSDAGNGQHHGSPWTLQLCLRPKSSLPAAKIPNADVGADIALGFQDLFENPAQVAPRGRHSSERGDRSPPEPSPIWLPESPVTIPPEGLASRSTSADQSQILQDKGRVVPKGEAGPSTPCHGSSFRPYGSPRTAPILSAPASPEPFDDSDFCRVLDASPTSSHQLDVADRISGNQLEGSAPVATPKTPGRIRVYNDLLPASSQPQTPQNLPEARHQSRLRGSYTAPAWDTSTEATWTPTTTRSQREFERRRELSPSGLQTPGFKGLYGGMENVDDAALAEQMTEETVRGWARPSRPGSST